MVKQCSDEDLSHIGSEGEEVEVEKCHGPYWMIGVGITFACIGVWLAVLMTWAFLKKQFSSVCGEKKMNYDAGPVIRIIIGILCTTFAATCTMM